MRLVKPPYEISMAVLKIADNTWRALIVIVLLPFIILVFVLIALRGILGNTRRTNRE